MSTDQAAMTDMDIATAFAAIQAAKGGPIYNRAQILGKAPAPEHLANAARIAKQAQARYHQADRSPKAGFELGDMMKSNVTVSLDLYPTLNAALADDSKAHRAMVKEIASELVQRLTFGSPVVKASAAEIGEALGYNSAVMSKTLASLEKAEIIKRAKKPRTAGKSLVIYFNPRFAYRGTVAGFKECMLAYEEAGVVPAGVADE